ncbi:MULTISPECIES: hypothetical protein [Methylomonas]|nr:MULTISPECIES: hypothetical protein [Methylomonas]
MDQERINAPAAFIWDSLFLNGPTVRDDFMTERASQQQTGHASFLSPLSHTKIDNKI